jgi:hypothetical protein
VIGTFVTYTMVVYTTVVMSVLTLEISVIGGTLVIVTPDVTVGNKTIGTVGLDTIGPGPKYRDVDVGSTTLTNSGGIDVVGKTTRSGSSNLSKASAASFFRGDCTILKDLYILSVDYNNWVWFVLGWVGLGLVWFGWVGLISVEIS